MPQRCCVLGGYRREPVLVRLDGRQRGPLHLLHHLLGEEGAEVRGVEVVATAVPGHRERLAPGEVRGHQLECDPGLAQVSEVIGGVGDRRTGEVLGTSVQPRCQRRGRRRWRGVTRAQPEPGRRDLAGVAENAHPDADYETDQRQDDPGHQGHPLGGAADEETEYDEEHTRGGPRYGVRKPGAECSTGHRLRAGEPECPEPRGDQPEEPPHPWLRLEQGEKPAVLPGHLRGEVAREVGGFSKPPFSRPSSAAAAAAAAMAPADDPPTDLRR